MKDCKRIASIAFAAILSVALLAPVSAPVAQAADATIKVESDDVHTYTAYQIIAGDFEEVDGELVVTASAEFGENVDSAKLIAALELEADATIVDVAAKLESMTAAEIVTALKADGVLIGEATTLNNGNNTVEQGYYYIVDSYDEETADILKVANDTITIEPKLTDDASVEKKVWEEEFGTPAVDGEGWVDSADAQACETVTFKLAATIPSNLTAYNTFYFRLDDTLSEGLTIDAATMNVKYYIVDANGEVKDEITGGIDAVVTSSQTVSFECGDVKNVTTANGTEVVGGDTIVVVYESVLGEGYNVTPTTGNDNAVTLTYSNNPEATYDVDENDNGSADYNETDSDNDGTPDWADDDDDNDGTADSEDTDDGDGTLDSEEDTDTDGDGTKDSADEDDDNDGIVDSEDDDADGDGTKDDSTVDTDEDGIIDEEDDDDDGDGINDNAPDEETTESGNDDTTETNEDRVRVVTYVLDVTKVDSKDTEKTLAGAEFQLKKGNEYAVVENGRVTSWTTDANAASKLTTEEDGVISLAGLDDGTYTLVETKAPQGYNGEGTEYTVVITSTLAETVDTWEADTNPVEELAITVNGTNGSANAATGVLASDIANTKGSLLPSTGGIGTILFYVCGGLLVVVAGVLLISKKRAGNEVI